MNEGNGRLYITKKEELWKTEEQATNKAKEYWESIYDKIMEFQRTGNIVCALYHKLLTQSSAPEDGQNNFPKHVELTGIINKPLLLHLVGCLYYLYQ